MEFAFEEKFTFGDQNFIKCYFNVDFGCSSELGCLIADHRGVLYSPMIIESSKMNLHRLNLIDVRNKNLVITCIYLITHNKRSFIFVACEGVEGRGYCLITYCVSNLEISESDNDLSSWQILEVSYKIMDLQSLTDENGNSVIILCGSDKKLHVYSLDARCIIRRKRKSNFSMSKIIEELLISTESINNYVSMAFPIRLYTYKEKRSPAISDAFLGYSNGIALWIHSACSPGSFIPGNTIIQEIPLFQGNSYTSTGTGISQGIRVSGKNIIRRNRSAFDLTEYGEKKYDLTPVDKMNSDNGDCLTGREINRFSASMDQHSVPLLESKLIQKSPKDDIPEHKTLLLDGIVTCLCFYLVPLHTATSDSLPSDIPDKSRLTHRMSPKSKKPIYASSIVIGLASGSVLLARFEDVERPVSILSSSHKRGGVLSMTTGKISSSSCEDIVSPYVLQVLHFLYTPALLIALTFLYLFWLLSVYWISQWSRNPGEGRKSSLSEHAIFRSKIG